MRDDQIKSSVSSVWAGEFPVPTADLGLHFSLASITVCEAMKAGEKYGCGMVPL